MNGTECCPRRQSTVDFPWAAWVVDVESPKRWCDLVIVTPNDHSLSLGRRSGAGPQGAWLTNADFRSTGSSSRDELRWAWLRSTPVPNPNRLERSVVGRVQRETGTEFQSVRRVDRDSPSTDTANADSRSGTLQHRIGGTPSAISLAGKEKGQSVTPTKPMVGNWGGTNLLPINTGLV